VSEVFCHINSVASDSIEQNMYLKFLCKGQKEGIQNLLINANNIWRHNNKANIY